MNKKPDGKQAGGEGVQIHNGRYVSLAPGRERRNNHVTPHRSGRL
jgi:hypothetical protein